MLISFVSNMNISELYSSPSAVLSEEMNLIEITSIIYIWTQLHFKQSLYLFYL